MASQSAPQKLVTSHFLVTDLHCTSCVSNIKRALMALTPRPESVSTNIVTCWVTVCHSPSLSKVTIRTALLDAGQGVSTVVSDDSTLPDDEENSEETQSTLPHNPLGDLLAAVERNILSPQSRFLHDRKARKAKEVEAERKARHLLTCNACRQKDLAILGEHEELSNLEKTHSASFDPLRDDKTFSHDATPPPSEDTVQRSQDTVAMRKTLSQTAKATFDSTQVTSSGTRSIQGYLREKAISSHGGTGSDTSPNLSEHDPDTLSVVIGSDDYTAHDTWQASIAISGMTCASCVNSIEGELRNHGWINKASVNLLSNSATVDFSGKEHLNDVITAIEDIGFEATLDKVVDITAVPTVERTMEIKIAGVYCETDVDRVRAALETFAGQVFVEKFLSPTDDVLRIKYTPKPPELTIRRILAALTEAQPGFQPSVYHPLTLEERSAMLHAKERLRILKRVILSIVVAIPTFIIGIVYMSLVPSSNSSRQYLQEPLAAGVSRSQWALFILSTPVYFYSGGVFHERAIKEVYILWKRGSKTPILRRLYRFGSMNMLISLGTSIAYIASVAQLISAGVTHNETGDGSFYFDSVVFLTMFLLIGRLIEAYSKARTGDAISMLGKLRPTEAILVLKEETSMSTKAVNVDLLEMGDTVRVPQGASPPSDGIVIEGESSFDESSLTGEAKLVKKTAGDEVYSGTVNKGPSLLIKITGVAGNSMLDQIVNAVRAGQTQHAPIERLADALTGYFVPMVTAIAIITWIIWLSLGLSGALPSSYLDTASGWVVWSLQFAIAVFVIACPCGLGLAAPTALFVGSGLAAQNGILVKGGGEAFEKASRIDCIVFDKTGTLTLGGEPVVTNVSELSEDVTTDKPTIQDHVLNIVYKLEAHSSHPIAKAMVSYCKDQKSALLDHVEVKDVEEIPGKGIKCLAVKADSEEAQIIAGNESLMTDYSVDISDHHQKCLLSWKLQGCSVVLVAIQRSPDQPYLLKALFGISDPIRPESAALIKSLQNRGTDVWLLSGDNETTARAIGTEVGIPISNIIAGVLPSEKAERIKYLQRSLSSADKHHRALIAMIGDGINDAPALTAADVGIAIGAGSDIAISAADFVLISPDLGTILTLLDLSKIVFRRIKFNFAWALIYNVIGIPVAAGVLYPIISQGHHVRLDPVWASLAMALSSVSVVCSSLALRCRIPWVGFVTRSGSQNRNRG